MDETRGMTVRLWSLDFILGMAFSSILHMSSVCLSVCVLFYVLCCFVVCFCVFVFVILTVCPGLDCACVYTPVLGLNEVCNAIATELMTSSTALSGSPVKGHLDIQVTQHDNQTMINSRQPLRLSLMVFPFFLRNQQKTKTKKQRIQKANKNI